MIKNQNFGNAIEALKHGKQAMRQAWGSKDVWLSLLFVKDGEPPIIHVNYPEKAEAADDTVVPWMAGHSDVLAEDWLISDDFSVEFGEDALNEEDRVYIQSTIEKEGFDHAFVGYSDFSEIENPTFHVLRQAYLKAQKAYLKAQSELEEFINQ